MERRFLTKWLELTWRGISDRIISPVDEKTTVKCKLCDELRPNLNGLWFHWLDKHRGYAKEVLNILDDVDQKLRTLIVAADEDVENLHGREVIDNES